MIQHLRHSRAGIKRLKLTYTLESVELIRCFEIYSRARRVPYPWSYISEMTFIAKKIMKTNNNGRRECKTRSSMKTLKTRKLFITFSFFAFVFATTALDPRIQLYNLKESFSLMYLICVG